MPDLPESFREIPARVSTDGLRLVVDVAAVDHRIVFHLLEADREALRRLAAGADARGAGGEAR